MEIQNKVFPTFLFGFDILIINSKLYPIFRRIINPLMRDVHNVKHLAAFVRLFCGHWALFQMYGFEMRHFCQPGRLILQIETSSMMATIKITRTISLVGSR